MHHAVWLEFSPSPFKRSRVKEVPETCLLRPGGDGGRSKVMIKVRKWRRAEKEALMNRIY